MRGLHRRRDRRAGGDHGHRGRRRRAQRHGDGHHGRRPVRRLPAPPAPRPGRPRRAARPVPAGHRLPGRHPARERLDAVAATLDGFELSRVDLEQRREGDVLGVAQSGRRSSLKMLSSCATRTSSTPPARTPRRCWTADPELAGHPVLRDGDRQAARRRARGVPGEDLRGRGRRAPVPGKTCRAGRRPRAQLRGRPPPECRPRLGPLPGQVPRAPACGRAHDHAGRPPPGSLGGRRNHHARDRHRTERPLRFRRHSLPTLDLDHLPGPF